MVRETKTQLEFRSFEEGFEFLYNLVGERMTADSDGTTISIYHPKEALERQIRAEVNFPKIKTIEVYDLDSQLGLVRVVLQEVKTLETKALGSFRYSSRSSLSYGFLQEPETLKLDDNQRKAQALELANFVKLVRRYSVIEKVENLEAQAISARW